MPLPTDMGAKLLRQMVLAGMADLKEDQDKAKWKYALENTIRNGGTCVHAFFVRSTENQSGIGGL
ncbi:uncharacterized protein LOC112459460 isoform X1 [Temnothorax curvispinosus]|uniref:Uncharacterized protein LOC112459460 isoform X1 n=1 Tax=Temnothorax curvispinosus TaxID=300111 RepID=A0A6J1QDD0_9HYME|nr:uncharacterized protein LOC112459460 isoform X1 [Temnothorax curvispinosus]